MKKLETSEINLNDERTTYISVLNILACMSVVGIHCTPFDNFQPTWQWVLAAFMNALHYFANGMFFMLTGATLVDYRKRYNTQIFFKKRFFRTVLPLIIWSAIALFVRLVSGSIVINNTSVWGEVRQVLNLFINNDLIYDGIYWFFYTLFAIYLIIPLISLISEEKRKTAFSYAIIVLVVIYSVIPWFRDNILYIQWPYEKAFAIPYLMFIFLGYYFSHYEISKIMQIIINISGSLAFLLLSAGTAYFSFKNNHIWYGFCGWYRFCAVALACMIFTNCKKYLNFNDKKCFIKKIASASLGIYLMHNFIAHCLPIIFKINTTSPVWFVFGAFLIWLFCLIIVLVLKKIPILKYLVA